MSYYSNSKLSDETGVSLFEIAIVLIILGIIGGLSIPLLSSHIKKTALTKTKANQEYVFDAIATFVEQNRRFPCPADPQAEGVNYGVSLKECRGNKAIGVLPFRTLGINESFVRDGYKKMMTYVVDSGLTDIRNENSLMTVEGWKITIIREDGNPVMIHDDRKHGLFSPNFVAFVLISDGLSRGSCKVDIKDGHILINEKDYKDAIIRWESRDQFLKHFVSK